MTTNFQRTADWLAACCKTPSVPTLSLQIGCHIEEMAEFLECLITDCRSDNYQLGDIVDELNMIAGSLKKSITQARIRDDMRAQALDALCDCEVTGNGVAYLAGFKKDGADAAVLACNDAKLVDGKPVILLGGKIGKPEGWQPPDLTPFI